MPKQRRKSAIKAAVVFGVLTGTLYSILFTHADTVMKYFTRGGWFAFFPVATAFLFSLVHGAFTGSFWTALGIEASKSVVKSVQPTKRKRVTSRPRLYLMK